MRPFTTTCPSTRSRAGRRSSRCSAGAILRRSSAAAQNLGWVVHHQAVNGDVVINERTDSFEVEGKRWDVPVCGVFVIREGKIARWSDYFDMGHTWLPRA